MVIRNFEREANILATLNHPAIPKIYDILHSGDRSYLVMEYIEGKDLEAILNDSAEILGGYASDAGADLPIDAHIVAARRR